MAATVSEVERIFSLLLSPNTDVIRQATAELQILYKNPALLEALCHILLHSENPHIRQLSAVVLRKKLVQVWRRLSTEDRESLKNVLVECLASEMHHLVLRSTANLVSVIANHEYTHGQWPELSQFIMKSCQSEDPAQQEIGMLVLSSVMETAAVQLHPQYAQLLGLFSSALGNSRSKMVPYYALKSLTSMVEYLTEDEMSQFRHLIPKALQAIKSLIAVDEDKACDALELIDELMECDINLISPFLRQLVEFCLEISSSTNLDNSIRVKALSILGFLATLKKKTLVKLGLLPSMLQTILTIMVSAEDSDNENDDMLSNEQSHLPHSEASRVLDTLALNLPPEKIFNSVLQYVNPWLSNDCMPVQRRTALTIVGVLAEGCMEYIRNNYLGSLVQFIYSGLTADDYNIKNAALFAIGQFSEHLQPDIIRYSSEILPALFQFLDHTLSSNGRDCPSVTRTFYAVETFCENLGKDLLPYLPGLMDKLFVLLNGEYSTQHKELAISCVGAIANAVQDELVPYFSKILDVLKNYLDLPYQQDYIVLQAQAVDTLGIIAKTVGATNFLPIAEECVKLGITLMSSPDPDLRRSVYGMIASVSSVLKHNIVPHLQIIIPRMIESLQSDEGVKAYYSSFAVPFLDFEDEELSVATDESVESLEDEQDIEGYAVENAYIEEKEDTCNAIGEIAENVGPHFLPFIDDCFKEIASLVEDSAIGIRKAAVTALGRLCKVWYDSASLSQLSDDDKSNLKILINSTLIDMSASARTDADPTVVVATLESIEVILKGLKNHVGVALEQKCVESLLVTIEDVLGNKAHCQEDDDDGTVGQTTDVAEIEGLLLESAGSLLGPLASVVGGANILPLLKPVLDLLMSKLIVDGCGSASLGLANDLYPLFMRSLNDKVDEVCSNSVYGLGVLAANALPDMSNHYHEILQALFSIVHARYNGRLIDNICAAVSRMIISRQDCVPLNQVLPVLLQNLPLKEDMEEQETVYNCVFHLLQSGNIEIMNNLDLVLKAFATELSPSSKLPRDIQTRIIDIVQAISVQFPQQFEVATSCLLPSHTQILAEALMTSSTHSN